MGKLVVTEFVTLDGVAQAPGEPDEDRNGGFTRGGWRTPLLNQQSGETMFEQARSIDALLRGRRTSARRGAPPPCPSAVGGASSVLS